MRFLGNNNWLEATHKQVEVMEAGKGNSGVSGTLRESETAQTQDPSRLNVQDSGATYERNTEVLLIDFEVNSNVNNVNQCEQKAQGDNTNTKKRGPGRPEKGAKEEAKSVQVMKDFLAEGKSDNLKCKEGEEDEIFKISYKTPRSPDKKQYSNNQKSEEGQKIENNQKQVGDFSQEKEISATMMNKPDEGQKIENSQKQVGDFNLEK